MATILSTHGLCVGAVHGHQPIRGAFPAVEARARGRILFRDPTEFVSNHLRKFEWVGLPFGAIEGGVRKTAEEFEKEFLGEIPINPEVGKCGDEGKPIVEANPDHEISKIYLDFAKKIKSTYL